MSDVAQISRLPETVAEFLDWPGDGRAKHYELVDGVVRAMAPASTTHATIQASLAVLIGSHIRVSRPACRLLVTPGIIPRMNANENFRIPDLGVTCIPDTPRQVPMPEPLLLVEVLSRSNKASTWSNIWSFGTVPSLREILVVDSTKVEVKILTRGADGTWPRDPMTVTGEDVHLSSLDLSLTLSEIYWGTHLAVAR